jgi:hypothetical protein
MAHIFGFALAEQVGEAAQTAGLLAANGLLLAYLAVLVATRGRRSVHDLLVKTEVVSIINSWEPIIQKSHSSTII